MTNGKKKLIVVDSFYIDNNQLKQAISDNKDSKKGLTIRIKATHSGFVNENQYFYTDSMLEQSTNSFIHPYPKPVVVNHSDNADDVLGRITSAKFVPLSNAQPGTPTGYIELTADITDEEAIKKIQDTRYLTVSVRAYNTNKTRYTCSICNEVMNNIEEMLEHDHRRGQIIDGQTCFYTMDGPVDYAHVAFVSEPADENATVQIVEDSAKLHTVSSEVIMNDNKAKDPNQNGEEDVTSENQEGEEKGKTPQVEDSNDTSDSSNDEEDAKKKEKEKPSEDDTDTKDDDNKDDDSEKKSDDTSDEDEKKKDNENDENTEDDKDNTDDDNDDCKSCDSGQDDDKTPDWSDFSEDALDTINALNDVFLSEFKDDAKLSAAERKKLPDSAFCGPNRTFPVPDCAHVTAARRLIGRADLSEAQKKKVLACVNRKAKKMGCDSDDATCGIDYILKDETVKNYINENYYPKADINDILDKLTDKVINNIGKALNYAKYNELSKDFNRLLDNYQGKCTDLKAVKRKAIQFIKLVDSNANVSMDDIAVTDDELEKFDTIVAEIRKDYEPDTQDTTSDKSKDKSDDSKNQENDDDETKSKNEDSNKSSPIDLVTLSDAKTEDERREILKNLFSDD
jgi:hypothetical protein